MISLATKSISHHQRKKCKQSSPTETISLRNYIIFIETTRNMIQDLNFRGEVVTLIDPDADVIQDPAVQQILQSLDGERTVVSRIVCLRQF